MPASDSTAAVAASDAATDAVTVAVTVAAADAVTDAVTDAATDAAASVPDTTTDFSVEFLMEECGPGKRGYVACVNAVGPVGFEDYWTQLTVTVKFDVGGVPWCTKGTLDLSFRDLHELGSDGVKTIFARSPDNGARQAVDAFFQLYAEYEDLCFRYQQANLPDCVYTGFYGKEEEYDGTHDAILAFFARFPGYVKERDDAKLCDLLLALLE
jgi:hypothetical protein